MRKIYLPEAEYKYISLVLISSIGIFAIFFGLFYDESHLWIGLLAFVGIAFSFLYYLEVLLKGYYMEEGNIVTRLWSPRKKRKIKISEVSGICICPGYRTSRVGVIKTKKKVRVNGKYRKIECPWIMLLPREMNYAVEDTCNWRIKLCIGEDAIYGFALFNIKVLQDIEKNYSGKYYIPLDYYLKYQDFFEVLKEECVIPSSRVVLLDVLKEKG